MTAVEPLVQPAERPPSGPPRRQEIDHHTIKLVVGLIALFLGPLTWAFAADGLDSISASYYEDGWSRSLFIGFLFAVASFLLAYNGDTTREMAASKVAALATLGIVLFPCTRPGTDPLPHLSSADVHYASAAVMFLVLAWFCWRFFDRARAKQHRHARIRASIYLACGLAISLAIGVLGVDAATGGRISLQLRSLTFYGEAAGLVAFGVSWLTASRSLPLLTHEDERLRPFVATER